MAHRAAAPNQTPGPPGTSGLVQRQRRHQGPLEGFCRLRIGGIRIIYRQVSSKEIRLDYAQTRDVVYEIFERLLQSREKP